MKNTFIAYAHTNTGGLQFLDIYEGKVKDIEAYVLDSEDCPDGVTIRKVEPLIVENEYAKNRIIRKLKQKRIALEKALQDVNVKITYEEQ